MRFLLGGKAPVNRMGFGAMRVTGPGIWGPPRNRQEAHALLKRAIELGVNLMDTADSYGPAISEEIIAEALYPYPKDLVIATKGGIVRPDPHRWVPLGRPEYLMQCVEMSLRRLKLESIPFYQLHAIDPTVPLEDSLGALKKMQQQGKIQMIGVSNFNVEELKRALKVVEVVSVQNLYNLGNRQSEDVLQFCEKHALGFIPWYPLGDGELGRNSTLIKIAMSKGVTPMQLALAWLLQHSKAMLPIPGTTSIAHLEENMEAVKIHLSSQELELLGTLA